MQFKQLSVGDAFYFQYEMELHTMNTQDQNSTVVVFRVFPEGEVIALMPELPGTDRYYHDMLCYQHIGQHGSAHVDLVYRTKLATPEQYASLKQELETIGYNLKIRQRITYKHLLARKAEVERILN